MTKKITGFFSDVVMVLATLLWDNMLMGDFRSLRCNMYNRLGNVSKVKTGDSIVMFMFHFGKSVTASGFFHILSSKLFACLASDR